MPNTIKIRNKKTGEIREIPITDSQNYGLNPADALQRYEAQTQIEQMVQGRDPELEKLKKTEQAKAEIKAAIEAKKPKKLSETEQKAKKAKEDADRIITQLENLYFQDKQTTGLASGRLGGLLSAGKGAAGANTQLQTYKGILTSVRPKLARAMGDSGNFSLPEQEAAVKSLPTEFSTPDEAFAFFKATRDKFDLGPSKRLSEIEKKNIPSTTKQPTSQTPGTSVVPQQETFINSPLAKMIGGLGKTELDIGSKALNFLAPRTTKALTQGPQEILQRQAQRPSGYHNLPQALQNALLSTKDLAEVAVPAGVETGLLASPLTKLGLLKGGATAGALTGATTPEDISAGERVKKTIGGAAGGALLGGVLRLGGGAASAVGKGGKRLVTQVFRPNATELRDFKRFTGLDFTDEIMKRDLPFIKGKSGQDILEYYTEKKNSINNAADDFLAQSGKTARKSDLKGIIEAKIENLKPERGNIAQQPAIAKLKLVLDDLDQMGDEISLPVVNRIKRQVQDIADPAFGISGSTSPAANAAKDIQRKLGEMLESKAHGFKDVNKTIQFYHLAKSSVERKLNQAAGSEGGLVSQMLGLGGAGGIAGGIATGNPALGVAAAAPALMNALYRTPQFKTRAAPVMQKVGEATLPDFLKKLLLIGGGRAGASF